MKESNLIKKILLECPDNRRLFRNSVGVAYAQNGNIISFGVGGKGGADLIGWQTVEITPEMVGSRVAVFVALEVKTGRVPVTKEQRLFLDAVARAGGIAEVVRE